MVISSLTRLPILDELFASDTIIFLLIGLVVTCFGGFFRGKKAARGVIVNAVIYALCELLSDFVHSYMLEFIFLFVGTFALGSVIGFRRAITGTFRALILKKT